MSFGGFADLTKRVEGVEGSGVQVFEKSLKLPSGIAPAPPTPIIIYKFFCRAPGVPLGAVIYGFLSGTKPPSPQVNPPPAHYRAPCEFVCLSIRSSADKARPESTGRIPGLPPDGVRRRSGASVRLSRCGRLSSSGVGFKTISSGRRGKGGRHRNPVNSI